jgi:hypothetical protein
VEDVRSRARAVGELGALRVERSALAHPEAVLLVDDAHREPGEADVGLDEGVRANDERELAGFEAVQGISPCRGLRRAGQEGERNMGRGEKRAQRVGVLLGQRLGRRHQRSLVA